MLELRDGKLYTEIHLNSDHTVSLESNNDIDTPCNSNRESNSESTKNNESIDDLKNIDDDNDSDANDDYKDLDNDMISCGTAISSNNISSYDMSKFTGRYLEESNNTVSGKDSGKNNDHGTAMNYMSPRDLDSSELDNDDNRSSSSCTSGYNNHEISQSYDCNNRATHENYVTKIVDISNKAYATIDNSSNDHDKKSKDFTANDINIPNNSPTMNNLNNSTNIPNNSNHNIPNDTNIPNDINIPDYSNHNIPNNTANTRSNVLHNDSWIRECKLPNFSFITLPNVSAQNQDCKLRIRTNIIPKDNVSDDLNVLPIHHSLLKSMLQKAVRRRLTDTVIRLSFALASISTIELLRRLPIICLEDGFLHPGYPILIWCMVASSKGFILPDYLLSVCIHIIAEVTEARYMDNLHDDDTIRNDININQNNNNDSNSNNSNTTPTIPDTDKNCTANIADLPSFPPTNNQPTPTRDNSKGDPLDNSNYNNDHTNYNVSNKSNQNDSKDGNNNNSGHNRSNDDQINDDIKIPVKKKLNRSKDFDIRQRPLSIERTIVLSIMLRYIHICI
jgi:hypothetical protein